MTHLIYIDPSAILSFLAAGIVAGVVLIVVSLILALFLEELFG